jgi:hypothetical protein
MSGQIILYAVLLFPLVLGIVFRVNTSHIFFSLMAGELLARYFGHDLDKIAEQSVNHSSSLPIGELALIFIPMILTAIFMKATISKNKVLLHSIPLAITGIILAAFVLPILPSDLQAQIGTSQVGSHLLELNKAIIGGMVVLQLVSLWLFSRIGKKHGKHGE